MIKVEDWLEEDKLILLESWARDGLTEEQIANNIGVCVKTLYNWKNSNLPILQALKKGKEVVDVEVENALYKKALGYTIPVQKAFKIKEIIYDNGKKVKETEKIEYANEELHIPPDTTAQIFWLKNRKPDKWRDKVETYVDTQELTNVEKLLNKIENEAQNDTK